MQECILKNVRPGFLVASSIGDANVPVKRRGFILSGKKKTVVQMEEMKLAGNLALMAMEQKKVGMGSYVV